MKSKINPSAMAWLLAAGLAFGPAATQAAGGVTITQSQETQVTVGMSATEVQQNLGRPTDIVTYRNRSGSTWTYGVTGALFGATQFIVDFGSDGKVVSVGERVLGRG